MLNSLTSQPNQETRHRRTNLEAVIRRQGGIWTVPRAAKVNHAGGWGPNPNVARKDLKALVRGDVLIVVPRSGGRSYVRHPGGGVRA